MDKTHILVGVRAHDRKGYDGFARGGRMWPSGQETIAYVTPALHAILKAEKMLAVDSGVKLPKDVDDAAIERLDVPPRAYADEGALALEESAKLDLEIAKLEAQAKLKEKRAKLEQLQLEAQTDDVRAAKDQAKAEAKAAAEAETDEERRAKAKASAEANAQRAADERAAAKQKAPEK